MAYQQLGLIQATDYNALVDVQNSVAANTLNAIWAGGQYDNGYGQTLVPTVSPTGTVTATQWAQLINTLNSIKTHQNGTGTGISATTSGQTINYLSTLQSSLAATWSNRLLFNNTQGTYTPGSTYNPSFSQGNNPAAFSNTITRTVTFQSADQARYFFNAGGQISFVISSVANNDGTNRSADLVTLLSSNFSNQSAFRAHTNAGIGGSGGSVTTNQTSIGYYELTTNQQTLAAITSTTSLYTGDTVSLTVQSNGTQGLYQDRGTIITFRLTFISAQRTDGDYTGSDPQASQGPQKESGGSNYGNYWYFNDTVNITVNHRVDVTYPETTNLSNSWGSVTIG